MQHSCCMYTPPMPMTHSQRPSSTLQFPLAVQPSAQGFPVVVSSPACKGRRATAAGADTELLAASSSNTNGSDRAILTQNS